MPTPVRIRSVPRSSIVLASVMYLSAFAQAPPPPIPEAPKAAVPVRIRVSGPGPFVPLAHPVTIRAVSVLHERTPPPYSPYGSDWMGVDYGEVPLAAKIGLSEHVNGFTDSFEANGALRAAAKLCGRFLNVELPEPDSSGTLIHNGEDIAVARWNRTHGVQASSPVLLWDAPFATSLVLELSPATLKTPLRLEEFLTGLFIWGERQSKSLWLDLIAEPGAEGELLRGAASFHRVYQVYRGPELTISGYANHGEAWLGITFDKTLGPGVFEKDMVSIAERFPPLRTRVPKWTTSELIAAIGIGGRDDASYRKALPREQILVHELVARPDLTLNDFRSILRGARSYPNFGRYLPEAIYEAVRSEKGLRLIPAVVDYFGGLQQGPAELGAYVLLSELVQNKRTEFCDLSIAFVNYRLDMRDSLQYAANYCASRQSYEAVLRLDGNEYSGERAAALNKIAQRIGIVPR